MTITLRNSNKRDFTIDMNNLLLLDCIIMKNSKNNPIGIFDSGVGGLTVLKEVNKCLPNEDIIYLGDIAHLPYGGKSNETIIRLTVKNILFLLSKKVKFIIIACNSASSVALPYMNEYFNVPILGVVEAGVESAIDIGKKRIGIIGTRATIQSNAYQNLLKKADPSLSLLAGSCPLFVPLVEEGWAESKIAFDVAKKYLNDFNNKIDSLILGCTHYPLLKPIISKVLKNIILIDSAFSVAKKAHKMLEEKNLLNIRKKTGKTEFYLTDNSIVFYDLAEIILKFKAKPIIINHD